MKKIVLIALSVALVLTMGVVAVSAGQFIPSVEVKEAPDVVAPEHVEEGVIAVISDNEVEVPVAVSELFVTSLSDAKDKTDEISVTLVEAYNDIKAAEKVEDKVESLKDTAKTLGFESAAFSVANIFDVSVSDEHKSALGKEDAVITVVFTNDIKATQGSLIVAHQVETEWVIVDPEKVVVTEETITVDFDNLCPVMFITASEAEPVEPDGNGWIVWVIIAIVVVAAAAVAFVFIKKKNKKAA